EAQRVARAPQAGGFREVQDVGAHRPRRLRIGLFTNNYLPMLGGVTRAVETIRASLEALGHSVLVVAPRMAGALPQPGVLRVPAVPAPTYPDFALPLPVGPGSRKPFAPSTSTSFTPITHSSSGARPVPW